MSDQQVQHQFWSIERVIAFVAAPIVTPLSGALALWLGRHFPGVHVTGDAIYAFAATTAGGVAAAFIKWLDGRQKFVAHFGQLEGQVGQIAAPLYNALPEDTKQSLLQEFHGILNGELAKLHAKLPSGGPTADTVGSPEPAVASADPWAAPHDPAPAESPAAAEPPGSSQPVPPAPAADPGAAVTGA